jgi:hypothetical protein
VGTDRRTKRGRPLEEMRESRAYENGKTRRITASAVQDQACNIEVEKSTDKRKIAQRQGK